MIINVLTCKYLSLHIIILCPYSNLCCSNKRVRMCRLHVILVDWPWVSRWRYAVETLGSLSKCKMLALHPNMSLGLTCSKVYWDLGDSVNLFLIMPLSWDLLGIWRFVARYMDMKCHFRHPIKSPRLDDTEEDTLVSAAVVLLLYENPCLS